LWKMKEDPVSMRAWPQTFSSFHNFSPTPWRGFRGTVGYTSLFNLHFCAFLWDHYAMRRSW
jgi:hypothetical protein